MTILYGGKNKPHHLCCNYSHARINAPCSQCDHLYRMDELSSEELQARFAANAIRCNESLDRVTYGNVRDFMQEYGYQECVAHIEPGEVGVFFQNPHCNFVLVLPKMQDDEVLRPEHMARFRSTVLNNDPRPT